jgi:hypothetical protein
LAADQALPQGMAVRTVAPEESAKYFNQRVIQTGGGAAVGGKVATGGGDFTGRDQTVQGDKTAGDKFGGDKVRGNKLGGVSIGNVTGGIHGSSIAGRDVTNTTITTSGTSTRTEQPPTVDQIQQLLTEIQRELVEVTAQRDVLKELSPAAPFLAQGAAESVKDATNAIQPKLDVAQAQSIQQRLHESSSLLSKILDDAKTLAEKAGATASAVQPLVGLLEPVVTKLERTILWVTRLWLVR